MSTETYQEASYFFNNIKEIIKNDNLIVKFKGRRLQNGRQTFQIRSYRDVKVVSGLI